MQLSGEEFLIFLLVVAGWGGVEVEGVVKRGDASSITRIAVCDGRVVV